MIDSFRLLAEMSDCANNMKKFVSGTDTLRTFSVLPSWDRNVTLRHEMSRNVHSLLLQ